MASTLDVPIGAIQAVDRMMAVNASISPQYAKANIAQSQTDSVIVAAVAGKRILVLLFRVMAGATATNFTFNSASTAVSELLACGANGGQHAGFSPVGHFRTAVGEALTGTTGVGATVGIGVVYVLVD